jgi:uncharacterized protein YdeI (YjbR/CyaY-like superfamily)
MDSPKFFASQNDFRKWLEKNHATETEILVGFHKVGTGKPSMTWSESVDQALCFGWIDGVRKRIDQEAYTIRFTPRRPNSIWSAINIKKVEDLIDQGLMRDAGMKAFDQRHEKRSAIYSYETEPRRLSDELSQRFRQDEEAWKFFHEQPEGYRRVCVHFVMSAKQEKTRISRLEKLILASKEGKRL